MLCKDTSKEMDHVGSSCCQLVGSMWDSLTDTLEAHLSHKISCQAMTQESLFLHLSFQDNCACFHTTLSYVFHS